MSGYDAVVVGGRVAGAATALLLAREGLKVAIVERGRPGGDTVSTRDHLSHQLFEPRRPWRPTTGTPRPSSACCARSARR